MDNWSGQIGIYFFYQNLSKEDSKKELISNWRIKFMKQIFKINQSHALLLIAERGLLFTVQIYLHFQSFKYFTDLILFINQSSLLCLVLNCLALLFSTFFFFFIFFNPTQTCLFFFFYSFQQSFLLVSFYFNILLFQVFLDSFDCFLCYFSLFLGFSIQINYFFSFLAFFPDNQIKIFLIVGYLPYQHLFQALTFFKLLFYLFSFFSFSLSNFYLVDSVHKLVTQTFEQVFTFLLYFLNGTEI